MRRCFSVFDRDLTAYLGDGNSYSHAAAVLLAGGALKGYGTMQAVLSAVGTECGAAVLPVENNVEGAVNEVYDALFDCELYVKKQLVLPVRHSLIAAEGATLGDIRRVVSHPQAIAQCRRFLDGLGVPVMSAASTSAALQLVDETTAAVAFKPKDGQRALAVGIQDSALNATRFALLTPERSDGGATVSVAFDLVNEPGALLTALKSLYDRNVNMTRILSRPNRSGDGRYRFFVDFDFDGGSAALDETLADLKKCCTALRFLGRYDCVHAEADNK